MDELVDIVTPAGAVTGQILKTEAHKTGDLHKTVIGWLKFGDDWAMVEQAADRQDPGQLVAPVGGHVQAGETNEAAILREAQEELGVKTIQYKHIGNAVFHRQVIGRDENHLFVVYEITTDDPIVLGAEAVAIRRFTTEGLKQALALQPQKFGDAHYFLLEHFYPEFLPAGYQNVYKVS